MGLLAHVESQPSERVLLPTLIARKDGRRDLKTRRGPGSQSKLPTYLMQSHPSRRQARTS